MSSDFDRRTRSLWMDFEVTPQAPSLGSDRTCDTVIIGTGIAGISTAYELATNGQKVILIDRGKIAGDITGQDNRASRAFVRRSDRGNDQAAR